MGLFELLMKLRPTSRHAELLMVGLDNAGKTSIFKQLSDEDITHVMPTQGFQIKTLIVAGTKLNVWDMGGQPAIRCYWRQYFREADVIVYVVDSSQPGRIEESKRELHHLLEEEKLAGVPILVFANKQDLLGAMTVKEITEHMELCELTDRRWFIQGCSAKTQEGLSEGIMWIVKHTRR